MVAAVAITTRRWEARGGGGAVRLRTSEQPHSKIRATVGTVSAGMTDPDTCDLLCLDLPKAERLRAAQPAPPALERLAEEARALGDPTRLAVVLALRDGEPCCVCDLAWVVGRDEKLVSHHVRLLKAARLARSRREGRMVMYELTDRGRALIEQFATSTEAPA